MLSATGPLHRRQRCRVCSDWPYWRRNCRWRTVRQSLADRTISQDELANIAQIGANAAAGLSAQGGPQLQQLAGSIDDLTAQLARGQIPQASANLGSLQAMLDSLPSRP